MSAFLDGLSFGFARGMLNNMFGFGGFGGFWGNPFGCCCMPFNMSSLFMVPRLDFSNIYQYPTVMPQVNIPAANMNSSVFSWNNIPNIDYSAMMPQITLPSINFDTVSFKSKITDISHSNYIAPDTFTPVKPSKLGNDDKIKSSIPENERIFDNLIIKYAKKYSVDVALVRAIIKQESNFNPKAKSTKGAMGLMQLMPKTAEAYGVTDAYNPEQNIEAGVQILSDLSKKYNGDKKLILAAYNWGSGNLAKSGYENRPKETRNYIDNVLKYYNEYAEA